MRWVSLTICRVVGPLVLPQLLSAPSMSMSKPLHVPFQLCSFLPLPLPVYNILATLRAAQFFSTPLSCFRVLSFILTFELLDIYWEDCLEIRNQYDVIRLYQQHAECTTSINEHCFESQPAEVPYLPRKWALRVAPKILWEFTGVSGARRSVCFC